MKKTCEHLYQYKMKKNEVHEISDPVEVCNLVLEMAKKNKFYDSD